MTSQDCEIIPGPGVLTDLSLLRKRAEIVAPYADWIQIDIADGQLVPNATPLDPAAYKNALDGIRVKKELHMMVKDPLQSAVGWIDAGFDRLLFHIEGMGQRSKVKGQMSKLRRHYNTVEFGLAVDKKTHVDTLLPYLDDIDCALVMTIAAGFSGQKFLPEMLDKVRMIREKKPDLPIEVDGGITYDTAKQSREAGVTRLAVTSTIYNADDVGEAIERLKKSSSS